MPLRVPRDRSRPRRPFGRRSRSSASPARRRRARVRRGRASCRAVRSQVSSARARAMPATARARAAGSVSARTSARASAAGIVGRDGVAEVVVRAQLGERADGGDDGRHALRQRRGEHAGALDPAVGERDRTRRGRTPRCTSDSATKRRSHVIRPPTPSASARARSGSIGMRGLPTTSSVTSGTRRATAGQRLDQHVEALVGADQAEEEDPRLRAARAARRAARPCGAARAGSRRSARPGRRRPRRAGGRGWPRRARSRGRSSRRARPTAARRRASAAAARRAP